MPPKNKSWLAIIAATIGVAAFFALSWVSRLPEDALVVYCAHDSIYSDSILSQFEEETGIRVIRRFDTEATKSLGLVNRLLEEKEHPQCDVFWNNEVLGTMRLARAGVLEPYKGPGYQRIPKQYKSPDGLWTGFGARLRTWIVNTDAMTCNEETVLERWESEDLSRVAIARPLYGTTLVHFSLLWYNDKEELQRWFADAQNRSILVVNGNSAVKNLAADRKIDFGWTDTDDYFLAVDQSKPVKALPIRTSTGETICIPNSVAIVQGTKRRLMAEQLVDFLLSAETELALANSPSRQVPLGPVDRNKLPEEVIELADWAQNGFDLNLLSSSHEECLEWLLAEYGK